MGAHRRRVAGQISNFGGEQAGWGPLERPTTGSTSGSTTMRGSFPTCAPNRSSGAAPHRRRDCCRRGGVDGIALARQGSPIAKAAWSTAVHRTVVVDGSGRALYHLSGESSRHVLCAGACLRAWPPVTVRSGHTKLVEGRGVQGHLAIFRRPDGRLQVTLAAFRCTASSATESLAKRMATASIDPAACGRSCSLGLRNCRRSRRRRRSPAQSCRPPRRRPNRPAALGPSVRTVEPLRSCRNSLPVGVDALRADHRVNRVVRPEGLLERHQEPRRGDCRAHRRASPPTEDPTSRAPPTTPERGYCSRAWSLAGPPGTVRLLVSQVGSGQRNASRR